MKPRRHVRMFKPRFGPGVKAGTKLCTIRPTPKRAIYAGDTLDGRDKSGWPVVMQCVSFVGTASDIEIALYVYGFLTHHFAFSWTKHRGRCRNRRAFVDGMFAGLYAQLSAAEPKPLPEKKRASALVVADHQAYVAKFIGETEEKKFDQPDNDASAARRAGFNQGLNTKIAAGLKPADPTLTLK